MATYASVVGVTDQSFTDALAYTSSPRSLVAFSEWDSTNTTYRVGTATINTPNVNNIPGNNFSTPANGELTCNNVITTNGGTGNIVNGGPAFSNLSPFFFIGAVDLDKFKTGVGNMDELAGAFNNPNCGNGSQAQNFPGNMDPDTDFYTIVVGSIPAFGEPALNLNGMRLTYKAAVGSLATTLTKVQPPEDQGRPRNSFGRILTSLSDEEAAAVWLSYGFGLFKGDGESGQEAFWTP
jgi:hypothetical protein